MSTLFFILFAAYGMSTILIYGSIFENVRQKIKINSKFFGELIGCILCTSTWVGFFISIMLGGYSSKVFQINYFTGLFFDAMFIAGGVWTINAIVEFFEESRIK